MYKVFIENKPLIFQINSEKTKVFDIQKCRESVSEFLESDLREMHIEIPEEAAFYAFFDDHKYIEAAGGLVQRDDCFLFIQRHGLWDIPKGKLDKGETPEVAAVREIEEECGLIAPEIKLHLIDTWHTYPYKGKKVLKRTYWYWLTEGEEKTPLIPQTEEGITAVEYLKVDDFHKVKANTYLSIIEVIDELEKKRK